MTNKSISQLTAGGAVSATDLFPDVQTVGVGPVRVTAAQIGNYILSGSGLTGVLPVSRGGTGLTSLTAGRIPYGAGVSGTDPFGNSANLFWDAANSRLGVGTATPGYTLSVTGATNSTNAYFYNGAGQSAIRIETGGNDKAVVEQYTNGNGNWRIGPGITVAGAYEINSVTAGVTRMLVSSTGDVSIATSVDHNSRLNIKSTGTEQHIVFEQENTTADGWGIRNYGAAGGNLEFSRMTSTTTFSPVMTLTPAGNLGIGTSSPATRLEVAGSTTGLKVTGNSSTAAFFQATSVGVRDWSFGCRTTGTFVFNNGNLLGGTDVVSITVGGDVGIGTSSPGYRLDVQGSSASQVWASFKNTNASGRGGYFLGNDSFNDIGAVGAQGSSATAFGGANSMFVGTWRAYPLAFITNNTERARIDSSGIFHSNCTGQLIRGGERFRVDCGSGIASFKTSGSGYPVIALQNTNGVSVYMMGFSNSVGEVGTISTGSGSTSYNTSSDYRLKENVVPLSDALNRLMELKPSRFNFIAYPDETIDGFIAHEVAEVVPNAVTGKKDAVKEDGSILAQGMDAGKLVPLLTAAMQELATKVIALEAANG